MSEKAGAELHEALMRILEAQRVCAWCEAEFKTADELVDHIMAQHPRNDHGDRVDHVSETEAEAWDRGESRY